MEYVCVCVHITYITCILHTHIYISVYKKIKSAYIAYVDIKVSHTRGAELSVHKAWSLSSPNLMLKAGQFLKRHWSSVNNGSLEMLAVISAKEAAT